MPEEDWNALIRRVAGGDDSAFELIYRNFEQSVYRFALKKLNDPFEAADILHDVFLEVWRNAGRFEERGSVKSWIFAIAHSKVIGVFRKRAKVKLADEELELVDESPDGERSLLSSEYGVLVRRCLAALKPDHRTVVELAFFEDMSYQEIASVVGIPEGTVKSRVFHAKQLLLHCLEDRIKPGDQL